MEVGISDYIALGSLIVAALSLLVSLIPIIRDKAKLDFSLYIGKIVAFPAGKAVPQGDYYFFKIVNVGRRPVTIVNIGGITDVPWYQWYPYLITRFFFIPSNFIISSPEIISCLKDENGNDRTLQEGESTQAHLQILKSSLQKGESLKARKFWVMDSIGRKYFLPNRAHKKLKKDLEDLKREATK